MEIINRHFRNGTLKQYKKTKIKILTRDFCIKLSDAEIKHMLELKTEIQVDQFARKLLLKDC